MVSGQQCWDPVSLMCCASMSDPGLGPNMQTQPYSMLLTHSFLYSLYSTASGLTRRPVQKTPMGDASGLCEGD